MGFNPQKPKPQVIRALAPLAGTFDASPVTVNVANAKEVELLIRYDRSADALANNAAMMIIEFVNEQDDGEAYRRSIEDGTLTDDVNLDGVDSDVNATIKRFEFVGTANGATARVSYIVRVGRATALRFRFAESSAGATASQCRVAAALWLEGTQ